MFIPLLNLCGGKFTKNRWCIMFKKNFDSIEETVCNCLLGTMLIILSYQIILRYIFHGGTSWSEELSRYLFVWFVFIGMSYATLKGAHIKLEGIMNLFPKHIRKTVYNFGVIMWMILNIIVVIVGIEFCYKLLLAGQTSQGAHIKMWCIYAAIPIGFILTTFRLIQYMLKR